MGAMSDLVAMLRVKWQTSTRKINLSPEQTDLRYCYEVLNDVSRSFSVVIKNLNDPELRDSICIFHLVLRALDTVEDDMSISVDFKLKQLPKFHTHLEDPEWRMEGVGEGRERELLEKFGCVSREYKKLREEYQDVISDICEKMANGMCDFLQRPVVTKEDYNLYCHYVAGLVGHGLTRLFANCGFEDPHLADDLTIANHMGLFLQKTNIICDYFEDIREEPPRMFWPKEIWSKYAAELSEFKDPANKAKSLECLNAMVTDAMVHVPYVIEYMASLREPSVFRFCAIPQVMAIGTLAAVYNNADTFQVKVKMSKGEACQVMVGATTLYASLRMFREYCVGLMDNLDPQDASTPQLRAQLTAALQQIDIHMRKCAPMSYVRTLMARYPGLGGNFLVSMVDNVSSYFRSSNAIKSS